jgi:hypothetical protein
MPTPDPKARIQLESLLRERDQLKAKYYNLTRESRELAKQLVINQRRITELKRAQGIK